MDALEKEMPDSSNKKNKLIDLSLLVMVAFCDCACSKFKLPGNGHAGIVKRPDSADLSKNNSDGIWVLEDRYHKYYRKTGRAPAI